MAINRGPRQYVKIQNTLRGNGRVFRLDRRAAEYSAVICTLLEDFEGTDFEQTVIPLSIDVSDACLAKVFEWATYKQDFYKLSEEGLNMRCAATIQLTHWDEDYFRNVNGQMIYELLLATNYLDMKELYDMGCKMVVRMLRGKSCEEVCQALHLERDLTPEEEAAAKEAAIREANPWVYEFE
jgi:S-phase kinase-associated protein 1